MAHGNDWARGFMRGMHMRHDGWAELMDDEEHGGCLVPMMMLFHEHDEDPEMRPEANQPGAAGKHQGSHGGRAFEGVSVFQRTAPCQSRCSRGRSTSQGSQGRAERAVPVRFRQEVQAVLWRGDGELNGCGSAYDGRRPHLPPNRQGFFLGDFPTVSYQNCWLAGVRLDLTEPRKGSSYAKHCILLIAFTVEIGSEKIPLPAPAAKTGRRCRNP